MSNVIQWADAVEALKVIADEQKLVAGMTVAEAAAALKYTKAASGMYLKTVMTTSATSVVGTTAAEVASSAAGTAATTTAVNLTLVEGTGAAAGTAQVAGIGSIAIPVAACVAGAVGGYLIGTELNKNEGYVDFWNNVVFTVGDFVTGNNLKDTLNESAPTIPLLYDANGRAYLPSNVVTGVKTYLDTYAASGSPTALTPRFASLAALCSYYHITDLSKLPAAGLYQYCMVDTRNAVSFFFSHNQFIFSMPGHTGEIFMNGSLQVRYNTNGTYFTTWGYESGTSYTSGYTDGSVIYTDANIPNYSGGIKINISGTPLPTGITKYIPVTPPTTPILDPNGNTWTEVYLPSTFPAEMPNGEPVPETAPDPARIIPYIPPYQPQPIDVPLIIPAINPEVVPVVIPNPEPDTSTAPYPQPDPATDPSQLAEPLPVTEPVEPLPDPINTGNPTLPILPSMPSPSSAKGLLHVYNPTSAQVDLFGEWLWTTFSGDLIDTIAKLFNNPMDAVIGLHELYCTPSVSGTDVNIRAGYLESNVPSRLVASRYKEINCGALSIPEYWGNYLDYSPYTKSYCYLPFIGIVELNTDDIVGSGVEITYRIDTYNGSCIALITTAKSNSAESVTYQFDGNCSVAVPITSGMMTTVQNALIGVATTALSAAATAAVTVATGGTALPAAVMLGSVAAGSAKQGITSKNQVQYSGSFGSSFGAMGIKIPFLIIKRPRQKVVHGYNTNYGYPAHKMVLISTCSGYLKALEVDVVSPTATETEKKMIQEALKSGVFVD